MDAERGHAGQRGWTHSVKRGRLNLRPAAPDLRWLTARWASSRAASRSSRSSSGWSATTWSVVTPEASRACAGAKRSPANPSHTLKRTVWPARKGPLTRPSRQRSGRGPSQAPQLRRQPEWALAILMRERVRRGCPEVVPAVDRRLTGSSPDSRRSRGRLCAAQRWPPSRTGRHLARALDWGTIV